MGHSAVLNILFLCGMAGNLILPYSWGWVWRRYHPLKNDTIILSDPDCPVCWIQRIWRTALGILFIFSNTVMDVSITDTVHINVIARIAVICYGVFSCIIPSILSLTDIKHVDSAISRIHNVCYVFGYICLMITAMCVSASAFSTGQSMLGAILAILALINVILFAIYLMSDRSEFEGTAIVMEGLWEFLFLLTAYFPIGLQVIIHLIS